jgi:transcription termination factor Rho
LRRAPFGAARNIEEGGSLTIIMMAIIGTAGACRSMTQPV